MEDMRLVHELRELGATWEEVQLELPNTSDNTRKYYKGWLLAQKEQDDSQDLKNAKKSLRLKQKQKEIALQRSVLNEQIRDIAVHKTLNEQAIEAILNQNDVNYGATFKTQLPFEYLDLDEHHVFTLGDLHYNGDETLLEQLSKAFGKIISRVKQMSLKHVYLFELGDTIDGATLRNSQLFYVKSGMIQQVVEVSQMYVSCLRELMNETNVTFVSVDSSNHTQLRQLGTKQNQLVEEDVMVFINKYIETALPNLDFIHGEDVSLNIGVFDVFVAHGHLVKSKEKYIESLQSNRNIQIDYAFFGHYHHQRSIDLHAGLGYDKKVFYVPTLNHKNGGYEKALNLSSCAGIGHYVFNNEDGNTIIEKILIK